MANTGNTTTVKKVSTVGVKDAPTRRVIEELAARIAELEAKAKKAGW